MPLEILHGAFVLLGGGARRKGAQVAAPACFRIHLARIEAEFSGRQLAYHCRPYEQIRRDDAAAGDRAVLSDYVGSPSGKTSICSQRPLEFSISTSSWQLAAIPAPGSAIRSATSI